MSERFPSLPSLPGAGRLPSLPTGKRPVAFPKGPRLYGGGRDPNRVTGFGEAPPGFVSGTTSKSEWVIYAAIAVVLGEPENYRNPPFIGSPPRWTYQKPFLGTYTRSIGSAVIDFVVKQPTEFVAIRLQSDRFHVNAPSDQQAHDALQAVELSKYNRVADLYEQNFLGDPTGQAAVIAIKRALAGTLEQNPITSGTAVRARS